MALLGAIALGFGLVVLLDVAPHRLFHWLGVTHRNGWLFVVAGAVILIAALFSPVFGGRTRERRVRGTRTATGSDRRRPRRHILSPRPRDGRRGRSG